MAARGRRRAAARPAADERSSSRDALMDDALQQRLPTLMGRS